MTRYGELIEDILDEINAVGEPSTDATLLAFANELAAGVTAEREAAIAAELAPAYTLKELATAQANQDFIRVPRMVVATASKVGGGEWTTSTQGRRMRREKGSCAVGLHVVFESDDFQVVKLAILWRRVK